MRILAGIGLAFAAFLAYVALQPAAYLVERSRVIEAEPEAVYAIVSDLGRFDAWSPWSDLDPNMETTLEGTPGAVGMSYHWKGNDHAGEGRMTITKVERPTLVVQRLEFDAPMKSVATTRFLLSPEGDGTKLVWRMEGENGFMGKLMDVVLGFDAMIGGDYEKGLDNLEKLAESEVKPEAAPKTEAPEAPEAAKPEPTEE